MIFFRKFLDGRLFAMAEDMWSFPMEAFDESSPVSHNLTCLYTNSFSGQVCGQASAVNFTHGRLPACRAHRGDYLSSMETYRTAAVVPELEHIQIVGVHSLGAVDAQQFAHALQEQEIEPVQQRRMYETLEDIPRDFESTNECSVCSESVDLLSLPCRHIACFSCYRQLQSDTCPMCRANIPREFVRRL